MHQIRNQGPGYLAPPGRAEFNQSHTICIITTGPFKGCQQRSHLAEIDHCLLLQVIGIEAQAPTLTKVQDAQHAAPLRFVRKEFR